MTEIKVQELGHAHLGVTRCSARALRLLSIGDAMHIDLLDAPSRPARFSGAVFPTRDAPAGLDLRGEADHRIANHLAQLTAYVRLKAAALTNQAEEPTRESMHLVLDGLGAQIAAVARLHRDLACDARQESADLGEHLHQICTGFASDLSGGAEIIEEMLPGCAVRPDQTLPLSQVVVEAITSALRRVQRRGGAGVVLVGCRRDVSGRVAVEVTDSGPELPESFDPEVDEGMGYRLARAIGKRLGALIELQATGCGVRFCLTLPATEPWPVSCGG